MWICIFLYLYLLLEAGLFSCFEDLYGKWWFLPGLILSLTTLLSPIYLRIIIKNEMYVSLLSIIMCICFVMTVICCYNFTISRFEDFTVEKWSKYPNQRILMINDLKEYHNIIGMNKNDVLLLLGKPDSMTENVYTYDYDYGHIDIIFLKECVSSISVTDYF